MVGVVTKGVVSGCGLRGPDQFNLACYTPVAGVLDAELGVLAEI